MFALNPKSRPECRGAFTLLELLVVIAIIAALAAMMFPALSAAREKSRRAVCISNLRQTGIAIQTYAQDYDGRIPFGPKAPPFTSPANFYPSTGSPTSLLSLQNGAPVGLGLLLEYHLAHQRRVLFCPSSDQPLDAGAELNRVGISQAQGSYYYRHAGNTELFDNPYTPFVPENIQLHRLGVNRERQPVRALVMDTLFVAPPDLATFNVKTRTHHQKQVANVLYAGGEVLSLANRNQRFTVDVTDYNQLRAAFSQILRSFERADLER